MADRRDIAVIGLGTFGSAVAREMARMGDRVTGIDRDPARVAALDGEIDAVVQADATDAKVLNHLGINQFDSVIVAIGDDMQSSLLATLGVMKTGCADVHAKAQTPEHARILTAMGVRNLLEPESSFALHLAQLLHNPYIVDFLNLGNGNYIASINAPSGRACQSVADLSLERYDLACVGIDIGERILTQDLHAHPLALTDKLLLAGKRADLRRFSVGG
ncbi:MAG: TrkA family potassium uptake protein [Pseudomonadota bacterium]